MDFLDSKIGLDFSCLITTEFNYHILCFALNILGVLPESNAATDCPLDYKPKTSSLDI